MKIEDVSICFWTSNIVYLVRYFVLNYYHTCYTLELITLYKNWKYKPLCFVHFLNHTRA